MAKGYGPSKILKNAAKVTKEVAFTLIVEYPASAVDLDAVAVEPNDGAPTTFDKTLFNQESIAKFDLNGTSYEVVLFTTKGITVESMAAMAEAQAGEAQAEGPPEGQASGAVAPPKKGGFAGGRITVTITNEPTPVVIPIGDSDELSE